jgi:hypothetical protein
MLKTFFATCRVAIAMALGIAAIAFVTPSSAKQLWVSGHGANSGGCSYANPCRNIQYALNAVAADGDEIGIMDSAEYGRISITKSVSIIAPPGVHAVITADGVDAIKVHGSGIAVMLAGLTVNVSGANGIVFASGTRLSLDRIEVYGGQIDVSHTAPNGILAMSNSALIGGIYCFQAQSASAGAPAFATIVHSRADGCNQGFVSASNSNVAIAHSSAVGLGNTSSNLCYGDFVASGGPGSSTMGLDDVVATTCYFGVASGPYGGGTHTLTVSNSVITNTNTPAIAAGSSGIVTYGNNRSFSNAGAGYFGTVATTQ